jgi:NAD-dependent deacetylase
VEPNAGHHALVTLARLVPELTLVTQNVDGLHQRAGSDGVIEFHGNLFEDRCFVEGCVVVDADMSADVPVCPGCGGMLRPGVVWFGEPIPESAMHAAAAAVSGCDLFFSVGTSALVWPAAGLAEAARQQGAAVVEINLDATPLSSQTDFCLQGKSGSLLPELVDCLAL